MNNKPKLSRKYRIYADSQEWLLKAKELAPNLHYDMIEKACEFAENWINPKPTPYASSALNEGLLMADYLIELDCDSNTLAAAIVYPTVYYNQPSAEIIKEQLNGSIYKLLTGALRMEAIQSMRNTYLNTEQKEQQIDNVRKMLLAMVDDIRVVLIKLAERLAILKYLRNCTPEQQLLIAHTTMDFYAPLANRLGIGQIKWQLEDLSFRYLEPERYAEVSHSLKMRREERVAFIEKMIALLSNLFLNANLKDVSISGRAKHIYSIHRKAERKGIPLDQIYDTSAVRILVPTITDCYTVLSIVHAQWPRIPKEFDDYIARPKSNGYQSIHTAIIGPHNVNVEVQIRTHQMHKDAELGIAAHWKYKEGAASKSAYEDKIALLREVMSWQKEIDNDEITSDSLYNKIFQDRVYVFTPAGDIFDLPAGATALDFAYHVHTEIGHRCKGAIVNGHMTPLTLSLRTGDSVEILTAKNHSPSRDWLNPAAGYLKTAVARSKVRQWFRKEFHQQHLEAGHDIWDKAFRRAGVQKHDINKVVERFNFKKLEDLLAALGSGDLGITTVLHQIQSITQIAPNETSEVLEKLHITKISPTPPPSSGLTIDGVDDLLTSIARCCKPIPGDPIMGYITKGRGISIHHETCSNIKQAVKFRPERIMQVSWGSKKPTAYPVDIYLEAFDRTGLVRDISGLLTTENIPILALSTRVNKADNAAYLTITIETTSIDALNKILRQLRQIDGVTKADRR